jgi:hypothetical protein
MLHEFVTSNRNELIARCRSKVAKRSTPAAPLPTMVCLCSWNSLSIRFVKINRHGTPEPEPTPAPTVIGRAAALHGATLLRSGYTVDQVVHEYGDVCQSVTQLAIEQNTIVTVDEFRTMNRCLDNAIADAVTAFSDGGDSDKTGERPTLDRLAIHTFSAIQTGKVGLGGSTAAAHATTLLTLGKLLGAAQSDTLKLPKGKTGLVDRSPHNL